MNDSYIYYYDYYIPYYRVKINEILDQIEDSEKNKKYISKFGNYDEISIESKYNQFEMYHGMLDRYFLDNSTDDIKFLIFTGENCFANNGMSLPHYLIGKYNLKNASIICLNQDCSGTPQGINIANSILKSNLNRNRKIMIVSLSKCRNVKARYEWPSVSGDAAAIMILGKEGFLKIIDCDAFSDGDLSLRRCLENKVGSNIDFINEVKNFKVVVKKTIENNNLKMEDISIIIVQNVHYLYHKLIARSLNVKIEKLFLDNLSKGGHLGDVDFIRNLKDAVLKYKDNNSKFLAAAVGELGGNITYSTVLMEQKH